MPANRWQKCARKTLGMHDQICKVALSSEVIMTTVLGREKMMQLMIWIRYNSIKHFSHCCMRLSPKDAMLNIDRLSP